MAKKIKAEKIGKKAKQIKAAPVVKPEPSPAIRPVVRMVAGVPFAESDMRHLDAAIQIAALLVAESFFEMTKWQEAEDDIGTSFFRAVHIIARSMASLDAGWTPAALSVERQ